MALKSSGLLAAGIVIAFLGSFVFVASRHTLAVGDAARITIDEWDKTNGTMGLILSTATIKAGTVKFAVNNASMMKIPHEILIIANPKSLDDLSFDSSGAKLDEDKLMGRIEVGELAPGTVIAKDVSLKPGSYLLFCNQPGHFAAGMHQVLTVTQ